MMGGFAVLSFGSQDSVPPLGQVFRTGRGRRMLEYKQTATLAS